MSFIYTRENLKERINAGIQNRIGVLIDPVETMNQAVRMVNNDIAFRSARRKTQLQPNLFSDVYSYACPSDLNAQRIISIRRQSNNSSQTPIDWNMVPNEEFELKKRQGDMSIEDVNGSRILKLISNTDSQTSVIATLDSTNSGGGTWETFGDAENLNIDNDNYVVGGASLSWDINASGGTTAGIKNIDLDTFDLTEYLGGNGALFTWANINSTTGLTNYVLRIGSSETDYYTKTVTSSHDGTAFAQGFNLLRFDLTSLTTVGTPINTSCKYVSIFMTKLGTKISESDYKFDDIVLRKGEINNIYYYSNYGWQDSSGVYIKNSTATTDLLVANDDEFEIIVKMGINLAAAEANQFDISENALTKYKSLKASYEMENPSEAKIIISQYYNFIE